MPSALAIGDFSQATHLNIKALRHYHRIGLLEPAEVDPFTGHRRYTTGLRASPPDDTVRNSWPLVLAVALFPGFRVIRFA
jgi:hypothetical protein